MSYRIAGIDVHKKMLAVVVADVEIEGEYRFERRKFGSNPEHLQYSFCLHEMCGIDQTQDRSLDRVRLIIKENDVKEPSPHRCERCDLRLSPLVVCESRWATAPHLWPTEHDPHPDGMESTNGPPSLASNGPQRGRGMILGDDRPDTPWLPAT
jgi:hypothetical protein